MRPLTIIIMLSWVVSLAAAPVYDILEYGAVADGETINTEAIQSAIDECAWKGGGTVLIHSGTYVSGTIILKNHVTLRVEAGATLLASPDLEDYPDITPEIPYQYTPRFTRYLIYAEKAEQIAIEGRGTIDGRGRDFPYIRGEDKNRPYIIRFAECKNVRVQDIYFYDSARWLQHYLGCEDVVIDGITVVATTRENRDGIDIDSCDRVRISNCDINSGDDAIVLKATAQRPCKNVVVTNCVLRSTASALKLGTESSGGFENILFDNCAIYDVTGDAIALEMVDGGRFDRVTVSNMVIDGARTAIFVRLGNRARPIPGIEPPGMGSMQNIIIDNIQATNIRNLGCSITGLPDHPVEHVMLSNIRIRFEGGGTLEHAMQEVPEKPRAYPSSKMFETLPAYGFYCRHVRDLSFDHVRLDVEEPDIRPAMICDDVEQLEVTDFDAEINEQTKSYFSFVNVREALISNCLPMGNCAMFLNLEGAQNQTISLFQNSLYTCQTITNPTGNALIHVGENITTR
jgi:polygalacturonase